MPDPGDVTRLLAQLEHGGRDALDQLLPVVYDELRGLARRHLQSERPDHTLATGDLVHEAYLKLEGIDHVEWKNRTQFFAVAARAMRRVLVDHALARRAVKRGGARRKVPLEDYMLVAGHDAEDLVELDTALTALERRNPRLVRVVECRYFAGMSVADTAEVLGISPATVKRDWTLARAWLNRELSE